MLVLIALAGLALLNVDAQKRCPVTGTPLTAAQLADPSLRVGGKTVCCKDCVKKYAAGLRAAGGLRATATARAGRDAYEDHSTTTPTHSPGSYII